MNIYAKLTSVQSRLKAPKGQFNKFGKYNYRSCEDIMEAVKPLLAENGLTLIMSDNIQYIGTRHYLTATATLVNTENPEEIISATAMAREAEDKKGMDDSQITGTASSYARKYCLNGLFAIDDTKDADAMNNNQPQQPQPVYINQNQQSEIMSVLTEITTIDPNRKALAGLLRALNVQTVPAIHQSQFQYAMSLLVRVRDDAKKKQEVAA